jgi:hypothetical protein
MQIMMHGSQIFRAFLRKFEFTCEGMDGELSFDNATMRRIININETEISLDGSKTGANGRSAVSFYDPHCPIINKVVPQLYGDIR